MMNALKLRAESYNEWAVTVNDALEAKLSKKKSTWSGRTWYRRWGGWQEATSDGRAGNGSCRLCGPARRGLNPSDGEMPLHPARPRWGAVRDGVLHDGHMVRVQSDLHLFVSETKCFTFYTEP